MSLSEDELDRQTTPTPWWEAGTYIVVGLVTSVLLALHTFRSSDFKVDTTSLGLLGVLLLLPVAHRITKLKFGGVEAELSERRAQKHINAARKSLEGVEGERPDPATADITALAAADDPAKLLALDRLTLERALRRLATATEVDVPRFRGVRNIARELGRVGVIPPQVERAVAQVAGVLNAGAHGDIDDWGIALDAHQTVEELNAILDLLRMTRELGD